MNVQHDHSLFEKINLNKVKTNFAKQLFVNAFSKWHTEVVIPELSSKNFGNAKACEQELFYNINKFIYYKEQKLLSSPQNDISFWSKKCYHEFRNFVFDKDDSFEQHNKKRNIEIVFKNQHVSIIIPNTHQAARKYGSGTK